MRRFAVLFALLGVLAPADAQSQALATGGSLAITPGAHSLPLAIGYTVDDGGCPDGLVTVAGFSATFVAVTESVALADGALAPGPHTLTLGTAAPQVDGSSAGVAAASGPIPLPDGPSYTVVLTCAGTAVSTVYGILVRTTATPPAIVQPQSYSTVDYPIAVTTLFTTRPDGTYQLLFTRDGATTTVTEPGPPASSPLPGVVTATIGRSVGLADGTYSLTARYFDPLVHLEAQSSPVTLTIDSATEPPRLHPLHTTRIGGSGEQVTYTLPENAGPTGVLLRLIGAGEYGVMLHATAAGTHTVHLDPSDLLKTGTPTAGRVVADGTYKLSIAYQDRALHPPAASESISVHVDKGTRPLKAEVSSPTPTTLPIAVYLPEATDAHKLEVRIVRSTGATSKLEVAVKPGLHVVPFDRQDIAKTPGASNVSGTRALPAGTYTVTLVYRDSAENPPSTAQLSVTLT